MASEAIRYTPSYTADDYRRWQGDWELWDGAAVDMSPSPGFEHQNAATRLASKILQQLESNEKCDCCVVSELDWQVTRTTIVRPDVSVLCKGHPGQFISYPPALIAEVLSASTEKKDRTAKRTLYERQGVHFYLMLDTTKQSIEVLSLENGKYHRTPLVDERVCLSWSDDCRIDIPVKSIFSS